MSRPVRHAESAGWMFLASHSLSHLYNTSTVQVPPLLPAALFRLIEASWFVSAWKDAEDGDVLVVEMRKESARPGTSRHEHSIAHLASTHTGTRAAGRR